MRISPQAVPAAGEHGGDGPAIAAALGFSVRELLDLSLTLNPFAPPLEEMLGRHLGSLRHYPDPAFSTAALAETLGCDPRQVLLTNGAAEAIALVAGQLKAAAVQEPEFSLWRRHLATVDPDAPRVRSNPHSPSGHLAKSGEEAICWDEAFYQMATGTWSARGWSAGSYVVGSFTKLFACPGLRLGYLVAPDLPSAEALRKAQPAWSVGSLALAVLPGLLHSADLASWSAAIAKARSDLVSLLEGFGMTVRAADAPWVLVEYSGLRERLAPLGVLVRDCKSFGMPGVARIAVTDEAGLGRLERALVDSGTGQ